MESIEPKSTTSKWCMFVWVVWRSTMCQHTQKCSKDFTLHVILFSHHILDVQNKYSTKKNCNVSTLQIRKAYVNTCLFLKLFFLCCIAFHLFYYLFKMFKQQHTINIHFIRFSNFIRFSSILYDFPFFLIKLWLLVFLCGWAYFYTHF